MKYNLYQYLYITRFYRKRSILQREQRLRNEQNEFGSLRTASSMIRMGPKAPFFFLLNTIVMIGTSMSHPFRTLLLYGYSKTMQKSTNVFAYSTNLSARLRCHAAAGRAPILKLCSLITFWGRVAGEVRLMREARFNRHFILVL